MCNPGITKFLKDNPNGLFLETSAQYLGLGHGDTEQTHPYVPESLVGSFVGAARAAVEKVAPVVAALTAAAAPVTQRPSVTVTPRLSWHAQYCMAKFGSLTPPRG